MAKKNSLPKNEFPSGHTQDDFKCFGPPATEDGKFAGTMLCDMGCFKQGEVDSNKYYHAAVVQSKITGDWYAYFEYGRVGQSRPGIQFVLGPSKEGAMFAYEEQLHAKNDRRGQWVDKGVLGKILQPKPGKDCYLVRPQATRSTGLPDARSIIHTNQVIHTVEKTKVDTESAKLLRDLSLGTSQFTRGALSSSAIPTEEAIGKARLILDEATNLTNRLSSYENSSELEELTSLIYSIIPKKKSKTQERLDWLLTPNNILNWRSDIDAFENALQNSQLGVVESTSVGFIIEHMSVKSDLYKFISNWMTNATLNRHGHVRGLKIINLWRVIRDNDYNNLRNYQSQVNVKGKVKDTPLHQVTRQDLKDEELQRFENSHTCMLFHGTRSVNVGGILSSGLRLPKQLSNVSINGAMFGSGSYFADDWKKSAGYCSYSGSYWSGGSGGITSRGAFMFICDVALGLPYVPSRAQGFTSAPSGYHSVFGKSGRSGVANNELIIYNSSQQNLRYLAELEIR